MSDTTIKKVSSSHSPHGKMGQRYLAAGRTMSMRLWEDEPTGDQGPPRVREYETIGYAIRGRAELLIEDQLILLEPGDSWVVPKDARHMYRVIEPFTAVEVTHPPSEFYGRDTPPDAGAPAEATASD